MLDALLQAKWAGMKAALAKGDVEGAVEYFDLANQARYRTIFTALIDKLQEIAMTMQGIQMIYAKEDIAKYRIRKNELYAGNVIEVTYYINFLRDEIGSWKINSL